MLKHLYIKDYVIIDEIHIDFGLGMSVFTGETGAGKSIIIDAIGLLCGDRTNVNVIANDADKAFIEGVFSLNDKTSRDLLSQAGFDEADDYVISREIVRDGRSTMRLNYRVITQAFARELLSNVIDIHDQHETQYLLNPKTHRKLLDRFINNDDLLSAVQQNYQRYHQLETDLKDKMNSDFNVDDIEFLTYQIEEIEKAEMKDGELEELEEKQRRLMAFEKTNTAVSNALEALSANGGVLDAIYSATRCLSDLHDETIGNLNQSLKDKFYELDDIVASIKDFQSNQYFDEEELNGIQERIFFINKLRRKYGDTYCLIQKRYREMNEKLEMINHRQEYLENAEKEVKAALDAYLTDANKLRALRKQKAGDLTAAIQEQLKDLQLPNTRFDIEFKPQKPTAYGIDDIEFMISTNIGQALNPLAKIASGGELSRIMLGLKTIFNKLQGISTVIFDEIDAGISGSIATAIGLKMHDLSNDSQVFAVTHLGQVAACADHHYFVFKTNDSTRTVSRIECLDEHGRIKELAAIASGTNSESAMEAARELLRNNQALVQAQ